jgi:hypothetical protein
MCVFTKYFYPSTSHPINPIVKQKNATEQN